MSHVPEDWLEERMSKRWHVFLVWSATSPPMTGLRVATFDNREFADRWVATRNEETHRTYPSYPGFLRVSDASKVSA